MTNPHPAVALDFEFTVDHAGTPQEFHRHGEKVMEELLKLEICDPDLSDSGVGTDADQSTVTVSLLVFADDEAQALDKALTAIRSAVHAAGGSTPFWPTADDFTGAAVEYQPPQIQMGRTPDLVG